MHTIYEPKACLLTLREAIAYVRSDRYDRGTWREAERIIVGAGLCPNCLQDNHRVRLGPWEPGNQWEFAGRACPDCESFFACGEQPEFAGGAEDCYSDADPGL